MSAIYVMGMSATTSLGLGRNALPPLDRLRFAELGTIPEYSTTELGWKGLKRMSRAVQLSCMTIGEALMQAGVKRTYVKGEVEAVRSALLIGSTHSNLSAIVDLAKDAQNYGVVKTNPSIFPETVLNVIGGHAAIYFGIAGINLTISNGHYSGIKALAFAVDLLDKRQADRVVVCVVNLIPPEQFHCVLDSSLPAHESISVIVLSREDSLEPEQGKIAQFELHYEASAEKSDDAEVQPEDTVLALTALLQQLSESSQLEHSLKIDEGDRGSYRVALSKVKLGAEI